MGRPVIFQTLYIVATGLALGWAFSVPPQITNAQTKQIVTTDGCNPGTRYCCEQLFEADDSYFVSASQGFNQTQKEDYIGSNCIPTTEEEVEDDCCYLREGRVQDSVCCTGPIFLDGKRNVIFNCKRYVDCFQGSKVSV